jgi:large subunit ribosomal protein L41
MSLNLLRNPSVLNNTISDTLRKRNALTFRKTLGVYNFKVKPKNYYKNPHAIPLPLREKLKKLDSDDGIRKIHALENLSITPFGRLTHKGKFLMDSKRIPNYNIPDTEDFYVDIF